MAKKDKKNAKKDKPRDPSDVVEAVRGAVERTFQATTGGTEGARDRGRGLLDDVASAAQRLRESFDDLRVLEDVRGLRAEVDALARRVAELEKQGAKAPRANSAARSGTARASASRPGTRSGTGTARKATAKPSAARTAAATTGPKPKPAAARRKPAAPRPPSGGTS